jgi:hypothetical protein
MEAFKTHYLQLMLFQNNIHGLPFAALGQHKVKRSIISPLTREPHDRLIPVSQRYHKIKTGLTQLFYLNQ